MSTNYIPTRFLSYSTTENKSLILYNTLTGAIGAVNNDQAEEVKRALRRSARHKGPLEGILKDLEEGGFLIPEDTDEAEKLHANYLSKYDNRYLHLILMPTEQCNFRCVYCYESFLRGRMSDEIKEGIKAYIGAQEELERFELHWFGGEPLLAAELLLN
jgi:uncharacterized protein